jgi:hypothetical protein
MKLLKAITEKAQSADPLLSKWQKYFDLDVMSRMPFIFLIA